MLVEKLKTDQLNARKEKNEVRASLLTVLYSEIINIGKNDGNRQPTDQEAISLIKKFVKTADQNMDLYGKAGKLEAVECVKKELKILKEYLPISPNDEDLRNKVKEIVATLGLSKDKSSFGKIMSELKGFYGSSLDGATASKIVRAEIGG
jgi:uncharacterized protein YqeY